MVEMKRDEILNTSMGGAEPLKDEK